MGMVKLLDSAALVTDPDTELRLSWASYRGGVSLEQPASGYFDSSSSGCLGDTLPLLLLLRLLLPLLLLLFPPVPLAPFWPSRFFRLGLYL